MMERIWQKTTRSPEETQELGRQFVLAHPSDFFLALRGDLGMGKTVWVKGMAQGMGIGETVTSPTFTILHVYKGKDATLYHYDAYRLKNEDELIAIGCEEIFYGPDGVVMEWPERAEGILPPERYELWLERGGAPDERKLTLYKTEGTT